MVAVVAAVPAGVVVAAAAVVALVDVVADAAVVVAASRDSKVKGAGASSLMTLMYTHVPPTTSTTTPTTPAASQIIHRFIPVRLVERLPGRWEEPERKLSDEAGYTWLPATGITRFSSEWRTLTGMALIMGRPLMGS